MVRSPVTHEERMQPMSELFTSQDLGFKVPLVV